MAQIAKRRRIDDCTEEGLFGPNGLMFGKISTNEGIKAQGEFDNCQLINGRLFTDEFVAKGHYVEGLLLNGCRLHYAGPIYETGNFYNNRLSEGIRISANEV